MAESRNSIQGKCRAEREVKKERKKLKTNLPLLISLLILPLLPEKHEHGA